MLPYDYRPKRSLVRVLKPLKKPHLLLKLRPQQPPVPLWLPERPFRHWPAQPVQLIKITDLLVVMTLLLAIVACALSAYVYGQTTVLGQSVAAIRQSSMPVSVRNRLPTLTPTLPSGQLPGIPAPPLPARAPGLPGSEAAPLLSADLPSFSGGGGGGNLGGLPAFSGGDAGGGGAALPSFSPGVSVPTTGGGINIIGTLPAAPTSRPNSGPSLPTLPPGSAPTATATRPAASATPVVTPTATVAPTPETGWSFASVRVYGQENGLLLYGKLTNDTGAPQELEAVTGQFYDAQGQVVADKNSTYDYWPINVVPPGGAVPFELTVFDVQNAADYDLNVEAQPSGQNTRQDFEFRDVRQENDDGDFCLTGQLRNNGDQLQEFLVVAAILYDGQGNVINFDYYDEYDPASVRGDDTSEFEICVSPPNQDVANHELRAWGR